MGQLLAVGKRGSCMLHHAIETLGNIFADVDCGSPCDTYVVVEYNLFASKVNGTATRSSPSLAIMDAPSLFTHWL